MQNEALTSSSRFDLVHLARRFFQSLRADPLTPAEQKIVAGYLSDAEQRLFWLQSGPDQRHAYATMRRAAVATTRPEVLRAALLHDVGKAESSIGPVMRSVATVLDVLGMRLMPRMASYREHGRVGGDALAAIGADALAVDFARRHPDPDPGGHDIDAWQVLLDADDV